MMIMKSFFDKTAVDSGSQVRKEKSMDQKGWSVSVFFLFTRCGRPFVDMHSGGARGGGRQSQENMEVTRRRNQNVKKCLSRNETYHIQNPKIQCRPTSRFRPQGTKDTQNFNPEIQKERKEKGRGEKTR
jgi:hypothetical protein